jgi:hypothetical protein
MQEVDRRQSVNCYLTQAVRHTRLFRLILLQSSVSVPAFQKPQPVTKRVTEKRRFESRLVRDDEGTMSSVEETKVVHLTANARCSGSFR